MSNKPFPFIFIASTFFVLLSCHTVNSTLLQTVVETEYQDPVDQVKPQHIFLSASSPSTRSLEKDQVDYYEISISPRDNKLTISKENLTGQVELFVSLDPNNKYPSEQAHTYTTKTTRKNWIGLKMQLYEIELNKTDLTKACVTQSATLCAIYVAVIPQGTAVSYSISLERSFSKNAEPFLITPLEDGSHLSLPVPADNSSVHYYFYTLPFEPSFVTAKSNSDYKKVIAYAKVLDRSTDLSSILDMSMPTNSSYDYISDGIMLTLPVGAPALVLLSISFIDNDENRYSRDPRAPKYYSISLESQIMPLTLGKPYNDTTLPDQYRYFGVPVREECSLLVSAKSLEGKEISLVLAPPYGEELPTIEDCEYEERELYGAKFYEIRIEMLIGGRHSNFGTWTIGVYGQASSKFSLIATCGGYDIMQLQKDKTERVSMHYSRNEFPIYFLYKPETNNSISIRIKGAEKRGSYSHTREKTQPKGYYIRQLSKDENFVFNLPDKMNYQWSSFADIDREACNDCIYIIGIEGISDSSSFDITISERQYQIIEATNGHPVSRNLLPGDSNVITLLKYSQPDIYLVVTSEAEKLELYASNDSTISTDNYLWKTEIACNNETKVLKLPKLHNSEDKRYIRDTWFNLYLQIKNPTSQNVSYTLMILTGTESSTLKSNDFTVEVGTTQALILDASKENETIELNVYAYPSSYSREPIGEFDLEMKAYYWPEDASEVPALELPVFKIHVFTETTGSYGRQYSKEGKQQIFKINSRIGKFVFLLTHNANTKLKIENKVYTSVNEILTLDENSQTNLTLIPGKIQAYNVSLKGPGMWYLSAYSCNGISAYLSVQNDSSTQEAKLTRIGPDNEVFYQAAISEEESNQMIELALSRNENIAGFILRSTFLPKAVPYYDKLKENLRKSSIEVNKNTGVISVEIHPIAFYGYDVSQDTVFYEVLVCPGAANYLCEIGNDCVSQRTEESKLKGGLDDRSIRLVRPEDIIEFRVQHPGKYSVLVIAHIKSQGQDLKNIIIGKSYETIVSVSKQEDRSKSIEL